MRDPLAGTTREVGWSHRAGRSVVGARPLCHKPIGYRAQFRSGGWRVNGQEVALGEDALGDEDGVEGLGEAAVDRGVCDGFDDLGRGQADVE